MFSAAVAVAVFVVFALIRIAVVVGAVLVCAWPLLPVLFLGAAVNDSHATAVDAPIVVSFIVEALNDHIP